MNIQQRFIFPPKKSDASSTTASDDPSRHKGVLGSPPGVEEEAGGQPCCSEGKQLLCCPPSAAFDGHLLCLYGGVVSLQGRSTKRLWSGGSTRLALLRLPPRTWFTLIKNVISCLKEALQLRSLGEIFPSSAVPCGESFQGLHQLIQQLLQLKHVQRLWGHECPSGLAQNSPIRQSCSPQGTC